MESKFSKKHKFSNPLSIENSEEQANNQLKRNLSPIIAAALSSDLNILPSANIPSYLLPTVETVSDGFHLASATAASSSSSPNRLLHNNGFPAVKNCCTSKSNNLETLKSVDLSSKFPALSAQEKLLSTMRTSIATATKNATVSDAKIALLESSIDEAFGINRNSATKELHSMQSEPETKAGSKLPSSTLLKVLPLQGLFSIESVVTELPNRSSSKPELEAPSRVHDYSRRKLPRSINRAVSSRKLSSSAFATPECMKTSIEDVAAIPLSTKTQIQFNASLKSGLLVTPQRQSPLMQAAYRNHMRIASASTQDTCNYSNDESPRNVFSKQLLRHPNVLISANRCLPVSTGLANYHKFNKVANKKKLRPTASLPPQGRSAVVEPSKFLQQIFAYKCVDDQTVSYKCTDSSKNYMASFGETLSDKSKVSNRKDHQNKKQCGVLLCKTSAEHTCFLQHQQQQQLQHNQLQSFLLKAATEWNAKNASPSLLPPSGSLLDISRLSPKSRFEVAFAFDKNTTAAVVSLQGLKSVGVGRLLHYGSLQNQDRAFTQRFGCSVTALGVFDGHGKFGHEVAEFVSKEFRKLICAEFGSECLPRQSSSLLASEDLSEWLKGAFLKVDSSLNRKHPRINQAYSGCTASLVLCRKDDVHIAYVGDSRVAAYLFKGRSPVKIVQTNEHNPSAPRERHRVIQSGGNVSEVYLSHLNKSISRIVEAGLSVSRSFGDLEARKYGLICEAEVIRFNMNSSSSSSRSNHDGHDDDDDDERNNEGNTEIEKWEDDDDDTKENQEVNISGTAAATAAAAAVGGAAVGGAAVGGAAVGGGGCDCDCDDSDSKAAVAAADSKYCRMLLVLGSDGLWDTVSSEDLLLRIGSEKKSEKSLSVSTRKLAERAWKKRLKVEGRADDTTAILALFA